MNSELLVRGTAVLGYVALGAQGGEKSVMVLILEGVDEGGSFGRSLNVLLEGHVVQVQVEHVPISSIG